MPDSIPRIKRKDYNEAILAIILIASILVTVYVNLVVGIDVVYTHFYYVPIILSGIWYHKRAMLLALFLGLVHISLGLYLTGHILPDTFVRATMFLIVATIVGFLSERRDALYNEIRLLLQSTDEGIYGIDTKGRCIFINDSALKMLGYRADEIIGKKTHELIHYKDKEGMPCDREECIVIKSLKTGEGYRVNDDVFWKKNGTNFPVEFSSYPIIQNDEIQGAVVTFNDITERKKAEEEIHDAKDQAELYVDIMAHDINNMNQVGIGYLEYALESFKFDEEQKSALLKSLDVLKNSSALIDNVRKIQQVKTDTLQHQSFNLCDILQKLKSEYSLIPGCQINIDLFCKTDCLVNANALITEIFSNIIGNAIKHSNSKKLIVINILIDKVIDDRQEFCRVMIDDNGPGIPDELKKRLFLKSQKGITKASGKGLGIYLVRTLVEYYKGKVWVEDRVQGDYTQGARFIVMLPTA